MSHDTRTCKVRGTFRVANRRLASWYVTHLIHVHFVTAVAKAGMVTNVAHRIGARGDVGGRRHARVHTAGQVGLDSAAAGAVDVRGVARADVHVNAARALELAQGDDGVLTRQRAGLRGQGEAAGRRRVRDIELLMGRSGFFRRGSSECLSWQWCVVWCCQCTVLRCLLHALVLQAMRLALSPRCRHTRELAFHPPP